MIETVSPLFSHAVRFIENGKRKIFARVNETLVQRKHDFIVRYCVCLVKRLQSITCVGSASARYAVPKKYSERRYVNFAEPICMSAATVRFIRRARITIAEKT